MVIFWVGLGLFLLGAVVVLWARGKEAAEVAGASDPFFKWFLSVLKSAFAILTEAGHSSWERIAAIGTIVSALGILTAVVGLIAWAK